MAHRLKYVLFFVERANREALRGNGAVVVVLQCCNAASKPWVRYPGLRSFIPGLNRPMIGSSGRGEPFGSQDSWTFCFSTLEESPQVRSWWGWSRRAAEAHTAGGLNVWHRTGTPNHVCSSMITLQVHKRRWMNLRDLLVYTRSSVSYHVLINQAAKTVCKYLLWWCPYWAVNHFPLKHNPKPNSFPYRFLSIDRPIPFHVKYQMPGRQWSAV